MMKDYYQYTYKLTGAKYFVPCMMLYNLFDKRWNSEGSSGFTRFPIRHGVQKVYRLKFFYTTDLKSGKLLGEDIDVFFFKVRKYLNIEAGIKTEYDELLHSYEQLLYDVKIGSKSKCSTRYFPRSYDITKNAKDQVIKKLIYRTNDLRTQSMWGNSNYFEFKQRITIHKFNPKTKTLKCSTLVLHCSRYLSASEFQRYLRLELYKNRQYNIYQPCIRHKFNTSNVTYSNLHFVGR